MDKVYKFNSGLTLLYLKNNINNASNIEIRFDCGARCDGNIPGLSHFCEHMFFTGTKNLSKHDISRKYLDFGRSNASTGESSIKFVAEVISNELGDYLSTVQKMICESTFTKQAVEDEKKVVIQEIVRDADNYHGKASRASFYEVYKLDMDKNGILGSEESVNKITPKDVKNYVKKYFVSNNCYIYICSSLSFNKVKKLVKQNFESKLPVNDLKPLPYFSNEIKGEDGVKVITEDIGKCYLDVIFKCDKNFKDTKFTDSTAFLCEVMGDFADGVGKGLRLDNSLVYSVNVYEQVNFKGSVMVISTSTSKENLKKCIDVIADYINNLVKKGINSKHFEKEKREDNYYWDTRINSPSSGVKCLRRFRKYGRVVSDKELHKNYQAIKIEDVNDTVRDYFLNPKIIAVVYGNAKNKDMYTLSQIQKKFIRK